ncbi:integrin alpha-X-like [Scyliorhinus canicula]|uniref:integrin alpha-X-like n=1 Tax=Scyliorhinus canicula TaxID=7830 RepID=UPI0018F3B46C|nr:integrin alpha-X-like [Scyliorhinus canicula]
MDQNLRTMDWNITAVVRDISWAYYMLNNYSGFIPLSFSIRLYYILQIVEAYYYPLLAVIGVPVNLVTIGVLSQGKCGLSKCITHYLVAMATGDLLIIICDLILRHIPIVFRNEFYFLSSIRVCNVHAVLLYAITDCSVWFTVAFTFDRFVAICCPKLKNKHCTAKTASVVLGTVAALSILKNIFWYFMLGDQYLLQNMPWFCFIGGDVRYSEVWIGIEFLHHILTPCIPFILILLLNVFTVRQIVIGSYFGSELCSLDLNGDGGTDLLLIGAPLYHAYRTGGIVIVCTLSAEGNYSCPSSLQGQEGNGLGRFGSAVAALGDLSGDGLADVAVGAPLEDGHRGSIYIYHGAQNGIAARYSQRIAGSAVSPGLRYFGQSIQGNMDVSQDGLNDLVVGALGKVVLLRSRPVVDVTAAIMQSPEEIALWRFVCPGIPEELSTPVSNLTVCFNVSLATSAKQEVNLQANLTYELKMDVKRLSSRVLIDNLERDITRHRAVTNDAYCFDHEVFLTVRVSSNGANFSENEQTNLDHSFHSETIPVLYAVKIIISRVSCTRYISFQGSAQNERTVNHIYKVENLGIRDVPVKVTFDIPQDVAGLVQWDVRRPQNPQVNSAECVLGQDSAASVRNASGEHSGNMIATSWARVFCDIATLERNRSIEFRLLGVARSLGKKVGSDVKLEMRSQAHILLDEKRFVDIDSPTSHWAQAVTEVEFQKYYNRLPVVIGSSVSGFVLLIIVIIALYKCGFFNRNFWDKICDAGEEASSPFTPADVKVTAPDSQDTMATSSLTKPTD